MLPLEYLASMLTNIVLALVLITAYAEIHGHWWKMGLMIINHFNVVIIHSVTAWKPVKGLDQELSSDGVWIPDLFFETATVM